MQIGALGFSPYIYNTNSISRSSMGKVSPISPDVQSQKTDFSGLTSEIENINPLRQGETPNFTDILSMQMQIGRNHAARILPEVQDDLTIMETAAESMDDLLMQDMQPKEAAVPEENEAIPAASPVSDVTSGVNILELVQGAAQSAGTGMEHLQQMQSQSRSGASLYQMSHAAQAYASFMVG